MEVSWRDPRLVAPEAERQAKLNSLLYVGVCSSLLPGSRETWQGWRQVALL